MNTRTTIASWTLSVLFLALGSPALAGELKPLPGFSSKLKGRVFVRQTNPAPMDHLQLRAGETAPDRHAQGLSGNRGALQGRQWSGGPGGAGPELSSNRVKRLGLTLDQGGMATSVAATGNHCYVGTSGSMAVYDVTDPTLPVLGQEIGEPTGNLEIQGTALAAIMGCRGDFVLFDVTNPAIPLETSRVAPPEGFYYHDVAIGDTAAVAIGYGYLEPFGFCSIMQIIDVSDPSQAEVRSTVLGVLEFYEDILLDGTIVYLAAGTNGVAVYDITSTQWITHLGDIPDAWCRPAGMDLQGNLLCLIGYGMQMVDVSDPSHPVAIGVGFTAGYCSDVRMRGNLAYTANDDDLTLWIFDITDPTDPFVTAAHKGYGKVHDLFLEGDQAYLPDNVYGLLVMDITVPTSPQLASMTSTGTNAMGIDVEGDRAAVTGNFAELHTLDVSDPFDPKVVGTFIATPKVGASNTLHQIGVDLSGDTVVTGDWSRDGSPGLIHTYDVADPTLPDKKGELLIGSSYAECPVRQKGDLVYTGKNQLLVIDISDPTQPVQVGSGPTFAAYLSDIQLAGNLCFACSAIGEVALLDLTDPLAPQELSRITVAAESVPGIAIEDGVLGIFWESFRGPFVQYSSGLKLYDVTDPTSPTLLSELDKPRSLLFSSGGSGTVSVDDGRFYLCTPQQLFVIDAQEPEQPFFAAVYPEDPCYVDTLWTGLGKICTSDGLVYLTSHDGVEVLRFLDVGVFLTSSSDATSLSRGDRFHYEMKVENFTSEPQDVVVWMDAMLSNGMTGTPGYPGQPQVLRLNPGESIVHGGHGLIPFNAPAGTYELFVHVGTLADGELDCDRIVIEVTP